MKFYETFDKLIRDYHISAKELSQKTGISTSQISRYRKGTRKPNGATSEKLTIAVLHAIAQNGYSLTPDQKQQIQEALIVKESIFNRDNFNLILEEFGKNLT